MQYYLNSNQSDLIYARSGNPDNNDANRPARDEGHGDEIEEN